MKKIMLFFISACLTCVMVNAQVAVGPKAGVNFSTVSMDEDDIPDGFSKTMKLGLQFGAVVDIPFSDMISLQPEVLYIQKGYKVKADDGDDYFQTTANYLEVPVLGKVKFGSSTVKPYVQVGPYVGYWLSAKNKMKVLGVESEEDLEFDNDKDDDGYAHNRLDLGVIGGAGVSIEAGPGSIFVDARYGLGLLDMNKYEEKPDDYKKMSNRTAGISVGYAINITK